MDQVTGAGGQLAANRLTDQKVFCMSTYGSCVRAAISNGFNYMGENSGAVRFLKSSAYGVVSLGRSSRWVESVVMRFFLRNCHVPELISVLRWIFGLENGIFIVRLNAPMRDGTIKYHVFSFNCKESVVSDCAETFQIRLTEDSFLCCVGNDARGAYVKDVKDLCRKLEGKTKPKSHKMLAEIKKNKMEDARSSNT